MKKELKNLGRRVREIRGVLTQEAFGSRLGVKREHISAIERSIVAPGRKLLQTISDAFNINISWLLYGEGPKERQIERQSESIAEESSELSWQGKDLLIRVRNVDLEKRFPSSPYPPEIIPIPFLAMPVAAGVPAAVEDNYRANLEWPASDLSPKLRKHKLKALEIKGNSMAPSIPEGAICIVDMNQAEPKVLVGKLVVVKIEGESMVKRLTVQRGRLMLVSNNPDYQPILAGPEAQVLGRVIRVFWSPD